MNERTKDLEAIFHAAMENPSAEEREHYLDQACAGVPELRREVEELLKLAEAADAVIQAGREACRLPDTGDAATVFEKRGDRIGRYRLLEKIGEGGMGVVYMAAQREPVARKVALKIIKAGMDTRQVIARFEVERQALAMLDHPNIAQVLDAGATETGRPYFVMELVEGIPITQFCETNQLSVEARLKLFVTVCHAIESAHQKGIIHRDIKPSNVLVTMHNGAPHPMVIDFGVAKAIHQKLTEKTLFTNFGTMIGTPAYMSPEQAEMSKLDVDTRSDIYSLGVLLYEMLAGTTPFPEERLRSVACGEMQRIIAEEEPERPSTRLRRKAPARTEIRTTKSEIDSDLDWIVMKCLAKDRNRRYETANGLAADLQRHLDNEPVVARPPNAAYRYRKWVRRNKLAFAAATIVALVVVTASGVSTYMAGQARRDRARSERSLLAAVRLISEAFENVSPALAPLIGTSKPREDLANAALAVVDALRQDAAPSTEFRRVLAQLYLQSSFIHAYYVGNTTGEFEKGLRAAEQAIRLLEPIGSELLEDQQLELLVRAEMSAGLAAYGLMLPTNALDHYQQMQRWVGMLKQSTNASFADLGIAREHDVKWLRGQVLLQQDRTGEALTNFFVPLLDETQSRKVSLESGSARDLWELRDAHAAVGVSLLKLGRKEEAAKHLREGLAAAESLNRRYHDRASHMCMHAESQAQLGQVLLALNQPNEALLLFEGSTQVADGLRQRDPANAGFVQLQVNVLRCQTAGYAAWAQQASAPPADCHSRLERAQAFLDRAYQLVATIQSESLRKFLRHDLSRADKILKEAKAGPLPIGAESNR